MTFIVSSDHSMEASARRIQQHLDDEIDTIIGRGYFSYKEIQALNTARNIYLPGLHPDLNLKGVKIGLKSCVQFGLKSLQRAGDHEALKVEDINIAVRVMVINCYNYENDELLEKLPDKLGKRLNRAIHIECDVKDMDLLQRCLNIALNKGQFRKIFGPTVGVHYTGTWRRTGHGDRRDEIITIRGHRSLVHFFCVENIPNVGDVNNRFKGRTTDLKHHETMRYGSTRKLLTSLSVRSKGDLKDNWIPYTSQVVSIPDGLERGSVSAVVYNDYKGVYHKGKRRLRNGAYADFTKALKRNPALVIFFHCKYVLKLSRKSILDAVSEMGKGVELLALDCKYDEETRQLVIPTKYYDSVHTTGGFADLFTNVGITNEMINEIPTHAGSASSGSSSDEEEGSSCDDGEGNSDNGQDGDPEDEEVEKSSGNETARDGASGGSDTTWKDQNPENSSVQEPTDDGEDMEVDGGEGPNAEETNSDIEMQDDDKSHHEQGRAEEVETREGRERRSNVSGRGNNESIPRANKTRTGTNVNSSESYRTTKSAIERHELEKGLKLDHPDDDVQHDRRGHSVGDGASTLSTHSTNADSMASHRLRETVVEVRQAHMDEKMKNLEVTADNAVLKRDNQDLQEALNASRQDELETWKEAEELLLKGGDAEAIIRRMRARVEAAQAAVEARASGTQNPQAAVRNTDTASTEAGQTGKKGVTFDETSKQPGPVSTKKSKRGSDSDSLENRQTKGTATITPIKPPSERKGGNGAKEDDSVESVTSRATSSSRPPNKTSEDLEHQKREQQVRDLKGRIEAVKEDKSVRALHDRINADRSRRSLSVASEFYRSEAERRTTGASREGSTSGDANDRNTGTRSRRKRKSRSPSGGRKQETQTSHHKRTGRTPGAP